MAAEGIAARAGAAVGGDPVAELRLPAQETAAGRERVVSAIDPFAFDQKSHRLFSFRSREGPSPARPGYRPVPPASQPHPG